MKKTSKLLLIIALSYVAIEEPDIFIDLLEKISKSAKKSESTPFKITT